MTGGNNVLSNEMLELTRKKYLENNQRLFLVEGVKSDAIKEFAYIWEKQTGSFLCIVNDAKVAKEWKEIYPNIFGDFSIISSVVEVKDSIGGNFSLDREGASKFLEKHNKLFIVVNNGEENVLHAPLGKANKKSGRYSSCEGFRDYCVSDFLASCGYDNVVVDDIYSLLNVEVSYPMDSEYHKELSPLKYDKVDFMGQSFYMNEKCSYKRLKNIIDSSKGSILLSDVLLKDSTVYIYLVLSLLVDSFDFRQAKSTIRALCQNYEEDCYEMCLDVSDGLEDEEVVGQLLINSRGCGQQIPTDTSLLQKYIVNALRYYSEEDIFLRTVWEHLEESNKKYPSIQDVFEQLRENPIYMAKAISGMFFKDKIKEQLENAIKSHALSTYTLEETKALFSIFENYGVFHCIEREVKLNCSLMYRDDSAFDKMVRSKWEPTEEPNYSLIGKMDADYYKALILLEAVEHEKAVSPVLVVASDKDRITQLFSDLHAEVSQDLSSKKGIIVADYEMLRTTSREINNKSIYYFDLTCDINTLYDTFERTKGGEVLLTYDNLEAYFYFIWKRTHNELFNKYGKHQKMIPIDIGDYFVGKTLYHYEEVVEKINTIYVGFKKLVTGEKVEIKKYMQEYTKFMLAFSDESLPDKSVFQADIEYLQEMGGLLQDIFNKSISTDREGIEAVIEDVKIDEDGKEKREQVSIGEYVFFNDCLKYIRGNCDGICEDCNSCALAEKFAINPYDEYKKSVYELLSTAENNRKKQKKLLEEKLGNIVVNGLEEDSGLRGIENTLELIDKNRKRIDDAIESMAEYIGTGNKRFYIPVKIVKEINDCVIEVVKDVYYDYFDRIIKVFEKNMTQVIHNIILVNQAKEK
ncbi:MAG: hypothetical protein J6V71_00320 [Clostridia bacterium]|nr:hypothetical protein [Clostridia bacterium]